MDQSEVMGNSTSFGTNWNQVLGDRYLEILGRLFGDHRSDPVLNPIEKVDWESGALMCDIADRIRAKNSGYVSEMRSRDMSRIIKELLNS